MKTYIFIALLNIPVFLNACSYFEHIYSAEKYIVNSEFSGAIIEYNKAFQTFKYGRSQDYYNMLICAVKVKDEILALQYFEKTISAGYIKESIDTNLINKIFDKPFIENDFSAYCDSLYMAFTLEKNNKRYSSLNNLLVLDQEVSKNVVSGIISQYTADSIYYTMGKRLVKLIKTDSVPHKEIFDFDRINMRNTIPWPVIRHYFGMVNRSRMYINKNEKHIDFYKKIVSDSSLLLSIKKLIHRGQFSPLVLRDGLNYNLDSNLFGENNVKRFLIYQGEKGKDIPFLGINIIQEIRYYDGDYSNSQIEIFNNNRKDFFLPEYSDELLLSNYSSANFDKDKFKIGYFSMPEVFTIKESKAIIVDSLNSYHLLIKKGTDSKWTNVKNIKKENVLYYESKIDANEILN